MRMGGMAPARRATLFCILPLYSVNIGKYDQSIDCNPDGTTARLTTVIMDYYLHGRL